MDKNKDNFKIYTKTGDKGFTSLIGGSRVPKYNLRIQAYGSADELNSFTGLIRDQEIDDISKMALLRIQDCLFTLESELASPEEEQYNTVPHITENDVLFLENEIDRMQEHLPVLNSFILPGGHTVVSYCHIARCVCRRVERIVVELSEEVPVPENVSVFLNRLSDYFFVLARFIAQQKGVQVKPWHPR